MLFINSSYTQGREEVVALQEPVLKSRLPLSTGSRLVPTLPLRGAYI